LIPDATIVIDAAESKANRASFALKRWYSIAISLSVAFLSGLLLTCAFPRLDIGWLAFVALVPFFRQFPFDRTRTAFLHGFVLGLAFFCGLLYWIAVFAATKIGGFGVAAWFILSARESLWVGVFAAGTNTLWRKNIGAWKIVGAASLWTFCEWIRQLGSLGFGWGDLAYSQWKFIPLIQLASVTGIWGLSWLIVLVNATLSTARPKTIGAVAGLIAVTVLFGYARLSTSRPDSTGVPAAALQANISEDVPYDGNRPSDPLYFYGTLRTFNQMAAFAKTQQGVDICVTAETSIPGYPLLDPELKQILTGIAERNHVILIVGARATDLTAMEDTNSVFVFRPDGSMSGPYNKQQLVPFGEYVPLRKQLPFLNSFHVLDFDMQPGSAKQPPLDAGGGIKAGVAICYESTYPRFLREQVERGATFDIVVTDDTWYGRTSAAEQHLAMSVLRAAETDRSLVRCASTGISAVIDPEGKIEASAPIFKYSVVASKIQQRRNIDPFVRYGDWWIAICAALFIGAAIIGSRNKETVGGKVAGA
jgi:apolipoprotein N-acyltransferase